MTLIPHFVLYACLTKPRAQEFRIDIMGKAKKKSIIIHTSRRLHLHDAYVSHTCVTVANTNSSNNTPHDVP
jgi:hypothetical protein